MHLSNIPNVSILSITIAIMIALFLWAWRLKQQLFGMTEELEQSEKKYQKIFNSVVDSFIIFDAQGNVADVNWQAQKSFGYPYEEFTKISWKDLLRPDPTIFLNSSDLMLFREGILFRTGQCSEGWFHLYCGYEREYL